MAAITFYEQSMSGKLTALKCSVKTYFFAVGRKWLLKEKFKGRRFLRLDEMDKSVQTVEFEFFDPLEDKKLLLRTAMNMLTPRCRDMLHKRRYLELTIEEIAAECGISKNNVSSVLSQCLKKLIEIIKKLGGE